MKKTILLTCLVSAQLLGVQAASESDLIEKAIEDIQQGKYERALQTLDNNGEQKYPAVRAYNRARALYRQEKFGEAAQSFQKALETEDLKLQQKAAFNAGNSKMALANAAKSPKAIDKRMDLIESALKNYRTSISLNLQDLAAKRNYERALKAKEKLERQQQKQQKQQKQADKKKREEQKDSQKKQDQTQGQQKNDRKQPPKEGGKHDKSEPEDKKKQDQKPAKDGAQKGDESQRQRDARTPQSSKRPKNAEEMTKNEAKQLLKAMDNREKNARPAIRMGRPQKVEKDW